MLPETVPEVLRTSLQAAVLHLKTLPLDVDVLHFDYMDAPKVGHGQAVPPPPTVYMAGHASLPEWVAAFCQPSVEGRLYLWS